MTHPSNGSRATAHVPSRRAATTTTIPLAIEWVSIDELRPDPANPRRISAEELEALTRSIGNLGFVQPVLARLEDRIIIAGHQRCLAARRLGITTVPTIFLDISIEQAKLLNLALNRIGGEFDEQLLARLLADLAATSDIDLTLGGFDEAELKDLMRSLDAREKADRVEEFDLDAAFEEATRSPRCKPGEIWLLGEHRIGCGDATDPVVVERLLAGGTPTLLVTDPPYGVSLDPTWRDGVYNKLAPGAKPYMRTKGHQNTSMSGDTRVDWSEAFELVPSLEVAYVWHAGVHAVAVGAGLERIGFEIRSQIIWNKTQFTMGRGAYMWQHEPCYFAVKKGKTASWVGDHPSTVIEVASPKMIMGGSRERKEDHPAQKAMECMARPIEHHTGDIYDPFLGSGTTLVAAERLSRTSFGLELDPRYCDISLTRWERFSGQTAVRIDG